MSKPHTPLALFTLLILCMVSIWMAPVFLGTDIPFMDFTETDSDPGEFEEDLFLASCDNGGMIQTICFRIGELQLSMHPVSFAPVFPPPRPFYS
jgi:hypothetical protein